MYVHSWNHEALINNLNSFRINFLKIFQGQITAIVIRKNCEALVYKKLAFISNYAVTGTILFKMRGSNCCLLLIGIPQLSQKMAHIFIRVSKLATNHGKGKEIHYSKEMALKVRTLGRNKMNSIVWIFLTHNGNSSCQKTLPRKKFPKETLASSHINFSNV